MVCKKCGKEFEGLFCPYCGERAEQEMKVCPVCGNQRKEDEIFCSKCGYNFTARQVQATQSTSKATGKPKINTGSVKNAAFNALTFIKKHWKPITAIAAILVIAMIVIIPTAIHFANIFRTDKVDEIELGMSKGEVIDILGEPYNYNHSSSMYEWYSDNYLKLKEKLDSLDAGDIDSFEDFGNAFKEEEKLREELQNTEYSYIRILFNSDGQTTEVYFDNKRKDSGSYEKNVRDYILLSSSVYRFEESTLNYRAVYSDGSLVKAFAARIYPDDPNSNYYNVEWSDAFGNQMSRSINVKDNPNILARGECGENATYMLDSDGVMTISGTGIVTEPDYYGSVDDVKKLVFSEGITEIADDAFGGDAQASHHGYEKVMSIEFPSSLIKIGSNAFNSDALTTISIPENISQMGENAISGKALTVYIELNAKPYGWQEDWTDAPVVWNCLENDVADDGNIYYLDEQGVRYALKNNTASVVNQASVVGGTISIPAVVSYNDVVYNVVSVGGFRNCENLKEIVLEEGIQEIVSEAFRSSGLERIVLPKSLKEVGSLVCPTSIKEVRFKGKLEDWLAIQFYTYTDTLPSIHTSELFFADTALYFDGKLVAGGLTIPGSVKYVNPGSFAGYNNITSVTIEEGVVAVGELAFAYCDKLTNVAIAGSVDTIGDYAFMGCDLLETAVIEEDVDDLGGGTFMNCVKLRNVTLPESAGEAVAYDLFSGCTSLPSEEGVVYADNWVCDYAGDAKEVVIRNGTTRILYGAFSGCSGLTSVTIPDSVTSIGDYAFGYCDDLTSVTIGDGVTSIGGRAFSGCNSLTSVTIPDSVTSIGGSAFSDCSGLTSVTIGNGVTSIGGEAFSDCGALTSLTIPDSVTSIGGSAFSGCSSLTSITIPFVGQNADGSGEPGFEYLFGARGPTDYNGGDVPSSLREVIITGIIGDYAFPNCDGLTSITIGDSVTSIGSEAFRGCSGLTSVTIGNGVTSIGNYAFYGCSGLTSITIPDGATSIGNRAFSGCSGLTSIVIPDSVTSIGDYAFSGCSGLTSVVIPDSVTSIGDSAFSGCSGLTSVVIPDSVTSIGDSAFSGCSGLTSIVIPDSVTSIGNYAFSGCTSLQFNEYGGAKYLGNDANPYLVLYDVTDTSVTSFEIMAQTKIIYDSAFSGCSGLTSIVIPDNVTSIGRYAFSDCSGLESVTIGDGVTSIGNGVFYGCGDLISITIPDSVTSIGGDAFRGCNDLTSITIPDSVTSIEVGAFSGCGGIIQIENGVSYVDDWVIDCDESVTSVQLREGARGIAGYAFSGCSGLTSITIPDSVTSIGYGAFYACSGLTVSATEHSPIAAV